MEAQVISVIHNSIPTLLIVAILWGLGGWFFAQVLGKDLKDYIVFSVIVLVVLICILLFTSKDIQNILFGYRIAW